MSTAALPPQTEAEIWMCILHPEDDMSPQVARAILKLAFANKDITRMRELAAKASAGTLTPEEDAEAESFERAGSILSTLKSKARQILKRSRDDD